MKKLFAIGLILFACGCNTETRYTQQSQEIEVAKSLLSNYVNGEWDEYASHYADEATIFFNTTIDKPASLQETIAAQKLVLDPISSYSFESDRDEYEMVLTDDGETWVNFWGVWKATIAASGETFEIPVHITHQFLDGKIVKTFGFWNNGTIQMALMELQKSSEVTVDTPE